MGERGICPMCGDEAKLDENGLCEICSGMFEDCGADAKVVEDDDFDDGVDGETLHLEEY